MSSVQVGRQNRALYLPLPDRELYSPSFLKQTFTQLEHVLSKYMDPNCYHIQKGKDD